MWKRRVEVRGSDQWATVLARRVSRLDLRQRVGLQIALDSAALVLGLVTAQVGRFDFDVSALVDWGFWVVTALAVCLLHFTGTALHLYLGRYRFGGSDEVLGIAVSVVLTAIGMMAVTLALGEPRPVPISVPPLGGAVTVVIMFGVRCMWRTAATKACDLADVRVDVRDIRDLDLDLHDLVGRHQVDVDAAVAAAYLAGRRVLVTGAGGSIGSELCRQIHQHQPAELIMLDRDESSLRATQLSIYDRAMLDDGGVVLGDIRDIDFVNLLFAARRPEVVFHAAALKHPRLLERFPGEAVKTNLWGTLSLLEAAASVGVEAFVNISTDKAANPVSVLGHSKRISERLTAHMATQAGGRFVSVRFGHVLGRNGSVLTDFAGQIADGVPITVTHPEVTGYFVTVQEAVQLVLQAGAIGADGTALVLDMGLPVRIDDVARRLASRAGAHMKIVYTGLGDGEEMHDQLLGDGEPDQRPNHPLISEVPVPPLDPLRVVDLDPWTDECELRQTLARLGRGEDLAELAEVTEVTEGTLPRHAAPAEKVGVRDAPATP